MRSMPVLRDAWFYPVLFAGWCMMMLAVHGGYRFSGMPLPSASGMAQAFGLKEQMAIQGTISELEKGLTGSLPIPDQGQIVHNIGSAYYDLYRGSQKQEFLDSAFGYYSKSISLVDNVARFHYNLGRVYMAYGNFSKAKTCYEKALAINPSHMMALHNLGLMDFYQFKDDSSAEQLLEHEMRIGGQLPPAITFWGRLRLTAVMISERLICSGRRWRSTRSKREARLPPLTPQPGYSPLPMPI